MGTRPKIVTKYLLKKYEYIPVWQRQVKYLNETVVWIYHCDPHKNESGSFLSVEPSRPSHNEAKNPIPFLYIFQELKVRGLAMDTGRLITELGKFLILMVRWFWNAFLESSISSKKRMKTCRIVLKTNSVIHFFGRIHGLTICLRN